MLKKLTPRDVVLLVLLAAATIALTWKAKSIEKRLAGHSNETALVHKQAPDLSSLTLHGEAMSLADFKGKKKLVVSFWASWCGPCRMELPELKTFYEKYHTADSTFEIVAVSTDEDRFQAEKYVKDAKLPFPILWDENSKISDAYGVDSIPVLYVIDETGKIIYGQSGYGFGLDVKLRNVLGLKEKTAKATQDDNGGN